MYKKLLFQDFKFSANKFFKKIDGNYVKLFVVFIFILTLDKFWLILNPYIVPGWDQGYHLSNLYKTSLILKNINILDNNWWQSLWTITDSYRGPFTYVVSSFFINIFGYKYSNAILSNNIYFLITIITTYELGKLIFNKEISFWGVIIFCFSPFISSQRLGFMIDISQMSFINLHLLFLSKLIFKRHLSILLSLGTGITLAIIFLVKPTGIIYFSLPYFLYVIKIFKGDLRYLKLNLMHLSLTTITSILFVFNWVSINWLTIITSINNAFNWGIKYQDGYEINDIKSWTYYFEELPKMSGYFFIVIVITFLIIINFYNIIKYKRYPAIRESGAINFEKYFWWSSFPINAFLLGIIMSSKDPRFILPLFPIFCIFLSFILNYFSISDKYNSILKKIISSILIFNLITSQFSINNIYKNYSKGKDNWRHNEIVEFVSSENKNIPTTIAMIPDMRFFNTFNLESEAIKQNKGINVRQIVSNDDSYEQDLQNFDWFLLKTGDQGVMKSPAKSKLDKLVRNSNSFIKKNEWLLPDESKATIYGRRNLDSLKNKGLCQTNQILLSLEIIPNGIDINLTGNRSEIRDSKLLLDLQNKKFSNQINIAIPKFNNENYNEEEKCYEYSSIFSFEDYQKFLDKENTLSGYLLDSNLLKKDIKLIFNQSDKINNEKSKIFKANNQNNVLKMGSLLRQGRFNDLFNLVGLINQTDPSQKYLKDAEIILQERLKNDSNNLNNLYAIAISQILQKKALQASNTLDSIIEIDEYNPSAFLAKTITNIYSFNLISAEKNLLNFIRLNNDDNLTYISNQLHNILRKLLLKF